MIKRYCICTLLIIVCYGCTANIPQTHYYTFQPGDIKVKETDSAKYAYILGVEMYEADVPYQQDQIVFRSSPYEVNFYEYRRWLRPPTEMVMEQIVKFLASSGIFQRVHADTFESYADYILRGKVIMFDQWLTAENTSSVQVEIEYQLIDFEQKHLVWIESINTTATISDLAILETVKAFESALQDNIQQAIATIDHVFAQGL